MKEPIHRVWFNGALSITDHRLFIMAATMGSILPPYEDGAPLNRFDRT
jgi:hypothetical protein